MRQAFTLFELLVVLLLLSSFLLIITPRLEVFLRPPSKEFFRKLKNLLQETREEALMGNRFLLVVIDPTQRVIYQADKSLKPLRLFLKIPKTTEIKAARLISLKDKYGILFFPDGGSSGGELEIIDHQTDERVILKIPYYPFP